MLNVSIANSRKAAGRQRLCGTAAAVIALAAFCPLLSLTAGCGGSGGSSRATGGTNTSRAATVTFSFQWPSSAATSSSAGTGRAAPEAAQSIRITLTDAAGFTQSEVVNRPESAGQTVTASFTGLSSGNAGIVFQAFTSTNGSGNLIDTTPSQTVNLAPAVNNNVVLTYRDAPFNGVALSNNGDAQPLIGQTRQLTAQGIQNGVLIKTNPPGTWSTSNGAVVTVDANGLVTATGPGTATVTFTDTANNQSASLTFTISPNPITSIRLTTTSVTFNQLGQQVQQLVAAGLDVNGALVQDNLPGNWSSSDTNVAIVSNTGLVTAQSTGSALITFTDPVSGRAGSINVNVTVNTPFDFVRINPNGEGVEVIQGQSLTFTANGMVGQGEGDIVVKPNVPGQWTIDDTSIATVDATTGVVTGVKPGNTTLRFTDSQFGHTTSQSIRVRGGDADVLID